MLQKADMFLAKNSKNSGFLQQFPDVEALASGLHEESSTEMTVTCFEIQNMNYLKNFHEDQIGATAVEYAVLLALIAGVCFAAITLVGLTARGFWSESADGLGRSLNSN
jgi:Flp pilus assembly pilin Flp